MLSSLGVLGDLGGQIRLEMRFGWRSTNAFISSVVLSFLDQVVLRKRVDGREETADNLTVDVDRNDRIRGAKRIEIAGKDDFGRQGVVC